MRKRKKRKELTLAQLRAENAFAASMWRDIAKLALILAEKHELKSK